MRSYRLTYLFGIAVIALFLIIIVALVNLGLASVQRSKMTRDEIFARDLRGLAGLFDADEKYVLEKNLPRLTGEYRQIAPLLSPRQYYMALLAGRQFITPRTPPRNCYVELIPLHVTNKSLQPDRFCSYFTEDRTLGRYMFINMSYSDDTLIPLARGDTRFLADGLGIKITDGNVTRQWWIFIQTPTRSVPANQFELTAFQEFPGGRREVDRRIEGWAFITKQSSGPPVVSVLARMDYRAVREQGHINDDDPWPPNKWESININLERRNASSSSTQPERIAYYQNGRIGLSLAARAKAIYDANSRLYVGRKTDSYQHPDYFEITKEHLSKSDVNLENPGLFLPEGDILIDSDQQIRTENITDTSLFLEVRHPGTIVEKTLWQSLVLVTILLIVFLVLVAYSYFRLIRPIWMMTRVVNRMERLGTSHDLGDTGKSTKIKSKLNWFFSTVLSPLIRLLEDKTCTNDDAKLPYSDRNDEIGVLSSGFNALLDKITAQANKERDLARDRESTLRYIRHEVNNSLTVLLNSDPPSERRRKLLEKISYYFKKLDDRSGPEGIRMDRQIHDIAAILDSMVSEASMSVDNIEYRGNKNGVLCRVDDKLLHQAVENVLVNATEHRFDGTPIIVSLKKGDGDLAVIHVTNKGPNIPGELLSDIFDRFVTTAKCSIENERGIGLYNSRVYLKRMDGDIRAFNLPDGVAFEIALPLVAPENNTLAS